MYVQWIKLKNFRNYKEESVSFHPHLNLILGKNAQGKTNLLESIYITSLGKSFRTSRDSEMIGFGGDYARVEAFFDKSGEELSVLADYSKDGKSVQIDGVRISRNIEMLSHVYAVVFSPEDLKIVKDEPEKRRKFLDRELCQIKPVYYRYLGRYKKILQQRNTLLKGGDLNPELLSVWDQELVSYGVKIICERKKFIEQLHRISGELHGGISNGEERLELSYESSVTLFERSGKEEDGENDEKKVLKDSFLKQLKRNERMDRMRGNTSVGPHKDDLKICVNGVDIRHFGSQGQQRTAALSLKLAEIRMIQQETEEDPILLLDDVLSELDGERQRYLIQSLNGIQIFITAAEVGETLKQNMPEGFLFLVEQGRARRVEQWESL